MLKTKMRSYNTVINVKKKAWIIRGFRDVLFKDILAFQKNVHIRDFFRTIGTPVNAHLFISVRPFTCKLYGKGSNTLSKRWTWTDAGSIHAHWQIVKQIGTCLQRTCWTPVRVFSPREGKCGHPHSFWPPAVTAIKKYKSIQGLILKNKFVTLSEASDALLLASC